MAYDIHITRRNNWFDEGMDITPLEWRKIIDENPELKQTEAIEIQAKDGQQFKYTFEDAQIAKWKKPNSAEIIWFLYRRGEITVSNPDEVTMEKVRQIAKRVGARVQGDDGEFY